ncbi:MAG: hypothetical protein U1E29_05205 [Coriobacteriia bacterium]|nr:hypothetical protein [Coriobacteriia bacterium]
MIEVEHGLFVGSERDCRRGDPTMAVVHACKHPCHVDAVGYRGSLPSNHPNYLFCQSGHDLVLNMIDPPLPLFKPEMFATFLQFAQRHLSESRPLLVHCNQGESRAPSLALVFMAKVSRTITASSYLDARVQFEQRFSGYRPGAGIQTYLTQHWASLGEF